MVAENGEHSVGGAESGKRRNERLQFFSAAIDDISRENDKVGLEGIDGINEIGNEGGVVAPRPDMKVAYLRNLISVERFRQPWRGYIHSVHVDVVSCI